LAALLGQPEASSYDEVRNYWSGKYENADFEDWWNRILHDGLVEDSALPAKQFALRADSVAQAVLSLPRPSGEGIEIIFRPDPSIYDGQHANNAWLQELPKPLTKLTWDNAAILSPATAGSMGLSNGDLVTLKLEERSVEAPIWIQPGHAADAVTVHLGYGQRRLGKVGEQIGFDAYSLRTVPSLWSGSGLQIEKTGKTYELVSTQNHDSMEGRDLVRVEDISDTHSSDHSPHHGESDHTKTGLFPDIEYEGYAWGMTVDLNACTGCNACVVACQAENNIAVVGKEEVAKGREMHWIRIDRYYTGQPDNPETLHQPIMCQHCETAPCESVCPVAATVHSAEGLNDMVYNRCIGTRYCSNNCPYKVRRFNFLLYSDWHSPSLRLQRNPDVTVRSRGVMEKCTYCVQRINEAKIRAKLEDRKVEDGDIQTACQQTCPSQDIVFGDINDPNSRVSQLKAAQRNYGILTELKTVPRTTYLAKLKHSNKNLDS
jgi:molybdopterin-containing oxidoreductase family iron-sulfur binding subunit